MCVSILWNAIDDVGNCGAITVGRTNVPATYLSRHTCILQAANPLSKIVPSSWQLGDGLQGWRVVQREAVAEMGDGIVVGVHLFAGIPGLPSRAVSILLHPPVAEMVLPPPALVAAACCVHAPCLSLHHALTIIAVPGCAIHLQPTVHRLSFQALNVLSKLSRILCGVQIVLWLCKGNAYDLMSWKFMVSNAAAAYLFAALAMCKVLLPFIAPLLGGSTFQPPFSPLR